METGTEDREGEETGDLVEDEGGTEVREASSRPSGAYGGRTVKEVGWSSV